MTQNPRDIRAAPRHFTRRRAGAGLKTRPRGHGRLGSGRPAGLREPRSPFSGLRSANRYRGDSKIFESRAITAQHGP